MSYYTDKVNELWDEWIALTRQESGDPAEFIDWAVTSKRLALRPQDMKQLLRKQVTQALRQAKTLRRRWRLYLPRQTERDSVQWRYAD